MQPSSAKVLRRSLVLRQSRPNSGEWRLLERGLDVPAWTKHHVTEKSSSSHQQQARSLEHRNAGGIMLRWCRTIQKVGSCRMALACCTTQTTAKSGRAQRLLIPWGLGRVLQKWTPWRPMQTSTWALTAQHPLQVLAHDSASLPGCVAHQLHVSVRRPGFRLNGLLRARPVRNVKQPTRLCMVVVVERDQHVNAVDANPSTEGRLQRPLVRDRDRQGQARFAKHKQAWGACRLHIHGCLRRRSCCGTSRP